MLIQPDAKIMQTHLGSQTSLKTCQSMRTFTGQAKGIEQLAKNRFDQLTQAGQPLAPFFGPVPLAALMRRCNHLSIILLKPTGMRLVARKTFVGYVDPLRFGPHTAQAFWRAGTSGQKCLQQGLIVGTGWTKAIASNDSRLGNRNQQVKSFIPANPIAPADIGLTSQPSLPTPRTRPV